MIRNLLLGLAICSVFGFSAHSQEIAAAVEGEARAPVYFLVDASGSMQGKNKADAELLLKAFSLPRDQLVSVNYFGARPETVGADLCVEDINLVPPSVRGDDFAPRLPELGGKDDSTAITNAMTSALGKIVGPAKIIVITDGGEECDANFHRVRDAYPSADIEVLQVGDRPNMELQKIEISPSSKIATPLISPVFNLHLRFGSTVQTANAWATGWYERRVWFFAILSLLVGAGLRGSSFGMRASYYEAKTKSLENKRSELLKKQDVSDEEIDNAIPKKVDKSDVQAIGTPDEWKSGFFFTVALLLGAPLILADEDYPEMMRWIMSFVLIVALSALLWYVIDKSKTTAQREDDVEFDGPQPRVIASSILGLVAIGFVVWACWIDLSAAQSAAWFVLSAGLSAALAISASAPLLFVGSKWWQYETAKSNYLRAYTEALSSTQREKRRNAKRLEDNWIRLTGANKAWRPEIEIALLSISKIWGGKVSRARDVVIDKLNSIALVAGGNAASEERIKRLEEFLDSRSVAQRIRLFLERDFTKDQMVPLGEWVALADALETKNSRKIADAYVNLAHSLA